MRLKVGIVGAGFGRAFANTFAYHSDCDMVAICDLDERRAKGAAEDCGAKKVLTNYEDLLKTDVDVVGVFTPAPLHVRHAVAALEAGKHVLSAVPAAMTLDECRLLIDTVKRMGLKYMMAETSCYYPEVLYVKELAEKGEMGDIFYCESDYFHDMTRSLWRTPEGRATWRMGFPPFNYVTHNSSGIILVTGQRMVEVTAYGWEWGDQPPEWMKGYGNPCTLEVGLFRLSGGTVAKIGLCWRVERPEIVRFAFYGTKRSFEAANTPWEKDKIMTGEQITALVPRLPVERLHPSLINEGLMRGHKGSHPFIVSDFVKSILNDTRPPIDVYEAAAYTAPGICAHQSALQHRTIKIPDFGREN